MQSPFEFLILYYFYSNFLVYIYKLKNPDQYEVPPISSVDASYKTPKNVIYRLTGVDGEVSENRIEQLQDENDLEMNDEKKYALAKTLYHILPNAQSGFSILFTDFSNIESFKKDAHLLSWYLPILRLTLKIIDNLKEIFESMELIF